jgi:hypothetical protein
MPPALTDYTYAFGDSGYILNSDNLGLPFVDVSSVTGLDGAPLRVSTDEHQGQDGTYIDSPFMSSRTVVVTGTLYTDPSVPDVLLDQLREDYESDTVRSFYFQHPGQGLRYVNGQGGGCLYTIDTGRRIGKTEIQLMVLCGDPYIYAYPASTDQVSVPTITTVGMSFNAAFNLGFGGSIPSLTATVFNSGSHTAYPFITVSGACVNPTFSDGYGITMPFNLTMSASDTLTIDCRTKNVVLNGQQSRRSAMSGLQWFSVPKRSSSTIMFSAASGTATATVTLNSTYY